jgi:alkylation response protein AidB-like acyl-CoA dehydrogenase
LENLLNIQMVKRWCALYFENVFIPKENTLLGPGGFKKQITGFNAERIGNTALWSYRIP